MSIPLSLAYIKSYLFVISIARKVMPRYSCSRSCFTMLLTPFPLLDGVFLDRSLFFLLLLQFERARKGVIISFYFWNLSSFQEKKNILRVITARWSARRAEVSMKRKKGSPFILRYFLIYSQRESEPAAALRHLCLMAGKTIGPRILFLLLKK